MTVPALAVWITVGGLVVSCVALRMAGPALLGDRELPAWARRVVATPAPALLAGLVVVEVAGERWSAIDPGIAAGVAVTGVAKLLRAPGLVAVAAGVVTAALVRALLPGR